MSIISSTDLAVRTDSELAVLFHMVSQKLAVAPVGSPDRRAVIASLQNISVERSMRCHRNAPGF